MRLEIGGVNYTAAPFNGWYMGTEIGVRNFGDASRYNVLPSLAEKMGLDTRSERSLWIDRALLEMNVAVIHSFAMAKVSLVDHHMAARHFMGHIEREERARRAITGQWNWLVPPMSSSTTPVFHRGIQEHHPQAQLLLSGGPMGLVGRPTRSGDRALAMLAPSRDRVAMPDREPPGIPTRRVDHTGPGRR
jgi:nitric oxide synthase oxygenase domain/subunit